MNREEIVNRIKKIRSEMAQERHFSDFDAENPHYRADELLIELIGILATLSDLDPETDLAIKSTLEDFDKMTKWYA